MSFSAGRRRLRPDGRTLAVGCQDGTVRRFDLRSGRELPPLTGHAVGISLVGFTADGKSLYSFSADQKLYVWAADVNRDWRPKTFTGDEQTNGTPLGNTADR